MAVNFNTTGEYQVNGVPIGGGSSNPSVISLSAENSPAVTGTTAETLVQSLLIPANTFTTDGMLELLVRYQKTGTGGTMTCRAYTNTSPTLTGATQIATYLSSSSRYMQAIRTGRVNSNVLSIWPSSSTTVRDYGGAASASTNIAFDTSVDNYLIFSVQITAVSDSVIIPMARAVIYS